MKAIECHIQGVEASGDSELGALVACLLEHDALEHAEAEQLSIIAEATDWAKAGAMDWAQVVAEVQRAAEELGERGELVDRLSGCLHEELEFSGSVEFESGDLVFHVNCRACGRSGSTTVTNKDVLW